MFQLEAIPNQVIRLASLQASGWFFSALWLGVLILYNKKCNWPASARRAQSIRAGVCGNRGLSTLVKKVMKSRSLLLAAAVNVLLAAIACAQVALTDIGTTPPTPGAYDISQLINGGGEPPGLNYYWDDGATTPAAGFPAQTFTTLNNPQGYVLRSVAIQTVAGSGGYNPLQTQSFTLNIYQLSNPQGLSPVTTGLTNATLVASYTATSALLAQGDWMQWTGLGAALAPGTNYVFGFGRSPGTPANWEEINTATGLPYSGGQACLVPVAGGSVTYASILNDYDMTFDLGISLPSAPIANPPFETPADANLGVLPGANVTLT